MLLLKRIRPETVNETRLDIIWVAIIYGTRTNLEKTYNMAMLTYVKDTQCGVIHVEYKFGICFRAGPWEHL